MCQWSPTTADRPPRIMIEIGLPHCLQALNKHGEWVTGVVISDGQPLKLQVLRRLLGPVWGGDWGLAGLAG